MTDEISGLKGFFAEAGGLRPKEQTSLDEKRTTLGEPSPSSSTDAATANGRFSESVIRNALSPVKTKFLEGANLAISAINEQENTLTQAEEVVDRELEAAEELKIAVESNNPEAQKAAQSKLASVRKGREALTTQIATLPKQDTAEGQTQSVKFGREEKARIELQEIRFNGAATGEDLSSVRGITTVIQGLKSEKAELGAQRRNVDGDRQKLKDAVEVTSQQLSQIESESIRSFEDAEAVAQRSATSIRSSKSEALAAFSLNETVARTLLAP